ncbi:MAG: carbohydrate-binding protein, partial [Paucimonas sp.]|nr:carbohydrate-binding protein [Paucimonas sp.]
YWHNFTNPAGPTYPIAQVSDNYDIIVLSFADHMGSGTVAFNPDPASGGKAQIIADIKAKQAKGKKVIISIGGEAGNVDLSTSANTTNFINSMAGIIREYSLNGVDIDLEHGMNAANVTTAIRSLRNTFGAGFIITMAPQTIDVQPNSNSSYMQVIRAAKDIITTVHTQHYNSGSMLGRDGKVYSQGNIDFLTALADTLMTELRPDQVAIGVPASSGAAGSGYVSPTIVNNALDCMTRGTNCGSYRPVALYPTFRGIMTWSTNWDRHVNLQFSNTVKPKLNTLP